MQGEIKVRRNTTTVRVVFDNRCVKMHTKDNSVIHITLGAPVVSMGRHSVESHLPNHSL
jgi:hypothetical protein